MDERLSMCAGDLTFLTKLLEDGQDPNAVHPFFGLALWTAASYGRLEVVKILLQARADINLADLEQHRSPLLIATDPEQHGAAEGVNNMMSVYIHMSLYTVFILYIYFRLF